MNDEEQKAWEENCRVHDDIDARDLLLRALFIAGYRACLAAKTLPAEVRRVIETAQATRDAHHAWQFGGDEGEDARCDVWRACEQKLYDALAALDEQ